ncbi:DNA cytosine methyltransferase [Bradyrhizobium sp. 157]|uniref:DNA cytosine methyltransferase n=1 Tax=Bradyrhizobium sp. 157 TaxID=2782631 RepID=UPI002112D11E|nr:DNA cytosine methyltransferase [Bradyrhizobium sp. 157]
MVFVDAFAGCGGLSLGLLQAGWRGLFAIEHDDFAFATLKANLVEGKGPHKFAWPKWLPKEPIGIQSLLSKHGQALEKLQGTVDLLVGGPPCQGFSSAGRRRHDDPRNKLFSSYLKLVKLLKPKVVLIENVRGFTSDFETGANYASKLRTALAVDYDVHDALLDLSAFGVPQRRTRYFVLATSRALGIKEPFEQLKQELPSFLRSIGLQAPISSKSAISDLETARNGTQDSRDTAGFIETKYKAPLTKYQKLMNAGVAHPTDLRLARHNDDITDRFRQIIELSHAEGRLNTSITDEVRAKFGLKKRALRVLDPDMPSPTITSMPDDLLHYSEPRTLTVRENARLQSFPDWFEFKGKYTTGGQLRRREVPRFTQVANAVPPLVARTIGEFLMKAMTAAKRKPSAAKRLQQAAEFRAHI